MEGTWTARRIIFASFGSVAALVATAGVVAVRALAGVDGTDSQMVAVGCVAALAVAVAAITALGLARSLRRQIESAVDRAKSSSSQLTSAAHQQMTSAQQLAASTNEITTTIKELLATARQIADSACRVVGVAEETTTRARAGDQTVQRAQEAITGIKRQVDLVVTHMLDLGKKSQQIGSILELINELAEQTNILAINAAIESVGAGEAGKRFSVVAEEIRRLADRVAGAAREIGLLVEAIRAAANTTIMATEDGSKAVDAGTLQFAEVLATFKHIGAQVAVTTEAAREIELSTKQQTTAIEQVNIAMTDVAQAAKETEGGSSAMLDTSSRFDEVSRQLALLASGS
ncbi:MAG: methyl-accepting chemotaxis protein [Polyangiaceae bacterium]